MTGGLALAALAALALSARRLLVLAGWVVALVGLVAAVLVSRTLVTPATGGPPVAAWPGVALAIAAAGLLLAATVAADALPGLVAGGGWRRPAGFGALLLAAAAASAPVLAAASWLSTGVRGPVAVSAGPVLPPFVSVSSRSGRQLRTLVLRDSHGVVTYEVLRSTDPLLGSTELGQSPDAQRALDTTVSSLVAPDGGTGQNQGAALAGLDIGYVLLPAPADATLASALADVAVLRPVSKTPAFQLWRVAASPARVRVVEPGGRVVPMRLGTGRGVRGGGPAQWRDPGAGRAGRRLDRHAQRHPAAASAVPGRRLGSGLPAAARRWPAQPQPQPARPGPDRRAGSAGGAGRGRARAARDPGGGRGRCGGGAGSRGQQQAIAESARRDPDAQAGTPDRRAAGPPSAAGRPGHR